MVMTTRKSTLVVKIEKVVITNDNIFQIQREKLASKSQLPPFIMILTAGGGGAPP